MHLDDLPLPGTPAARGALAVATRHHSPAMLNHCIRSYLWATARARLEGLAVDDELLFVAALLHDIGLEPAFDSHTLPFEVAGGEVARVFATGAGWPDARGEHLARVIVEHMGAPVDPQTDAEGYLLEVATGLDISGASPGSWPAGLRAEVVERYPRLGLRAEFMACLSSQADRKPGSTSAMAVAGGIGARMASNPLGD